MKGINDLYAVTVQDVPADMFITEFATHLEKSGVFKVPQVDWVSRGSGRTS